MKTKPKSKIKIFSAYWWNPLFWIILLIMPFLMFFIDGIKAFYEKLSQRSEGIFLARSTQFQEKDGFV